MIQDSQNKMMTADEVETKGVQPTTLKAVSVLENEYFYPESNGYQAIAIRAGSRADAQKIYLERRKPVKVDEIKTPEGNGGTEE